MLKPNERGACAKLVSRSKLSQNSSRYGSALLRVASPPRCAASHPDPRFLVGARLRFVASSNRQNCVQFVSYYAGYHSETACCERGGYAIPIIIRGFAVPRSLRLSCACFWCCLRTWLAWLDCTLGRSRLRAVHLRCFPTCLARANCTSGRSRLRPVHLRCLLMYFWQ